MPERDIWVTWKPWVSTVGETANFDETLGSNHFWQAKTNTLKSWFETWFSQSIKSASSLGKQLVMVWFLEYVSSRKFFCTDSCLDYSTIASLFPLIFLFPLLHLLFCFLFLFFSSPSPTNEELPMTSRTHITTSMSMKNRTGHVASKKERYMVIQWWHWWQRRWKMKKQAETRPIILVSINMVSPVNWCDATTSKD